MLLIPINQTQKSIHRSALELWQNTLDLAEMEGIQYLEINSLNKFQDLLKKTKK